MEGKRIRSCKSTRKKMRGRKEEMQASESRGVVCLRVWVCVFQAAISAAESSLLSSYPHTDTRGDGTHAQRHKHTVRQASSQGDEFSHRRVAGASRSHREDNDDDDDVAAREREEGSRGAGGKRVTGASFAQEINAPA